MARMVACFFSIVLLLIIALLQLTSPVTGAAARFVKCPQTPAPNTAKQLPGGKSRYYTPEQVALISCRITECAEAVDRAISISYHDQVGLRCAGMAYAELASLRRKKEEMPAVFMKCFRELTPNLSEQHAQTDQCLQMQMGLAV